MGLVGESLFTSCVEFLFALVATEIRIVERRSPERLEPILAVVAEHGIHHDMDGHRIRQIEAGHYSPRG